MQEQLKACSSSSGFRELCWSDINTICFMITFMFESGCQSIILSRDTIYTLLVSQPSGILIFTKWIRIGGSAMSEAFWMPLLPMESECLLYCTWLHNCSQDPLLVCCYFLACWVLGCGLDLFSFSIYILLLSIF